MRIKTKVAGLVRRVAPLPVLNAIQRARGLPEAPAPIDVGGIKTIASGKPVLMGRYADLFDKWQKLDPEMSHDGRKYAHYNAAAVARLCSVLPGDFVCAGISYGVAARIIFDFVDFATLGKTLHLVDPFDGRLSNEDRRIARTYNQNIDYIVSQYPKGAPIEIHRASIPINLNRALAFVYTATGDPKSAAEAMRVFYADLVPGGMIVANEFDRMQSLGALESRSLWLPSGQGLLIKGPAQQAPGR